MITKIKTKGVVKITLFDKYGVEKSAQVANMVVNSGLSHIVSRMVGVASASISHIGVGTSSTAAAKTQTALVAQVVRTAASLAIVTTTVSNDTVEVTATFGEGVGTGALTEAGLFNASTGGAMISRVVFATINKLSTDTVSISWKITVS